MKLHSSITRWGSPAVLALAGIVALLAFTGGPKQQPAIANHSQDTIPTPKRNKVTREENYNRDLDKELQQLDRAKEQLEKAKDQDWDDIERKVEESMHKIDMQKIQQQVEEATRKIDYEKINRQVQEALSKIDFDKIQRDIEQSLEDVKKVDKEAIKKEIENAKKQVKEAMEKEEWKEDMKKAQLESKEEVKKAMEDVKKEMAKVKEEMKDQKFNFKKDMEKAKVELDNAKSELKDYQDMIYEMEKDGLLSTKEDYSIRYNDGELFINDKKQPESVTDKYKKYIRKKNIAIKKEDGKMKIEHHKSSDTD